MGEVRAQVVEANKVATRATATDGEFDLRLTELETRVRESSSPLEAVSDELREARKLIERKVDCRLEEIRNDLSSEFAAVEDHDETRRLVLERATTESALRCGMAWRREGLI